MKKKVGFFGGSFDPIHFGHINLALELLEKCSLDEVIFCPTFISPHKLSSPPEVDGSKRFEMVRLAIEDIPNFTISDIDLARGGTSFTVDSLRILSKELGSEVELHLLLSDEALPSFPLWKDYEEILSLASPIIGCRDGVPILPQAIAALGKNLVRTSMMDISSTTIRDRLKNHLYCGHLVPGKVLDYIVQYGLYCKI